nr:unnamed protein product [Callosobruchus chinensis]
MQKILDMICVSHPIKTLHVLSDGPTAQYRNKKSFFCFPNTLRSLWDTNRFMELQRSWSWQWSDGRSRSRC